MTDILEAGWTAKDLAVALREVGRETVRGWLVDQCPDAQPAIVDIVLNGMMRGE
jgi:hypothetical protein